MFMLFIDFYWIGIVAVVIVGVMFFTRPPR